MAEQAKAFPRPSRETGKFKPLGLASGIQVFHGAPAFSLASGYGEQLGAAPDASKRFRGVWVGDHVNTGADGATIGTIRTDGAWWWATDGSFTAGQTGQRAYFNSDDQLTSTVTANFAGTVVEVLVTGSGGQAVFVDIGEATIDTASAGSGATTLAGLTDTDVSGQGAGDALIWNGSSWADRSVGPAIWSASEDVYAGEVRLTLPGPVYMFSNTDRTTGESFDASEAANWSYYSQVDWRPFSGGKTYLSGEKISEGGVIYESNSNRVAGPTFDAGEQTNWTALTSAPAAATGAGPSGDTGPLVQWGEVVIASGSLATVVLGEDFEGSDYAVTLTRDGASASDGRGVVGEVVFRSSSEFVAEIIGDASGSFRFHWIAVGKRSSR